MKKQRRVYMDWAATTPVKKEVLAVMLPYFSKKWGNPSSLHSWGQEVRKELEMARKELAELVGADRVIFTGSATESLNLVHKGTMENRGKGGIITTGIEHKGVLDTCKHLEESGLAKVDYLKVDSQGKIFLKDFWKKVKKDTVLVSLMWVNNEVGSVQEIGKIGRELKKINKEREKKGWGRVWFHSDITQGIGYLDFDMKKMGLDLASMTGHKIGAPKGVGVLFLGEGVSLTRQMDGGGQEAGLRAGTENVAYVMGLCEAIKIAFKKKKENRKKVEEIRDYLIDGLLKMKGIKINGPGKKGAPHIVNCRALGVEGESLAVLMSDKGIGVSTGSACSAGDLKASHVLIALGISQEEAHGSIRFSFSETISKQEVDYVLKSFSQVIEKLRKIRKGINV
jgi:cysteine desulfurase